MKELREFTWDELIAQSTLDIHMGIMESGGKGMKSAVHWTMERVLRWHREIEEYEKKKAESAKKRKRK